MKKALPWILLLVAIVAVAWGVSRPGVPDAAPGATTSPEATVPGDGWQDFASSRYGFSVRYPQGWTVANDHPVPARAGAFRGMAFAVPAALTDGTNLSADSAMMVEIAESGACAAGSFIEGTREQSVVTENGREWRVARGGGAGAGNFYDDLVYATAAGDRCFGLRLFMHSTNVGNYEPGTVTEFDRAALEATFAQFRASFQTL